MAREKEGYRENLEILNKMFPGKAMLSTKNPLGRRDARRLYLLAYRRPFEAASLHHNPTAACHPTKPVRSLISYSILVKLRVSDGMPGNKTEVALWRNPK